MNAPGQMVGRLPPILSPVFIWEIFFIQLKKTAAYAVNSLIDDDSSPRHPPPAPVAQMVEHRAVTREVVSSTPAGPTLRVFK